MSNVIYKQDSGRTMTVRVTSNDRGPRGYKGDTGEDGVSVESLSMNEQEHLIGHLSNGRTTDAGEIPKALSQRIDLGNSDGETYEFTISPAVDPTKVGYIMLNGVIYTDEFEVNSAGNKLTLSFEEGKLPSGKLQLIVNDTGIVSKTSAANSQVKSVNGKTGVVRLTAKDVKALPDTTKLPAFTSDLINNSDYKTGAQVNSIVEAKGYQTASDVETAIAGKADSADLATVATTGSYNDLTDKPSNMGTITGSTDPSTTTEGGVGQFYLNTTSTDVFVCTAAATGNYSWAKITGAGDIPVTGVEITTPASATDLYMGSANIELEASVLPANATDKTVTWSSSDDTKVAVVYNATTGGFEAQAIANGTATITVTTTDGSFTDTVDITAKTHVTGVSVSPATASPMLNATEQLTATFTPATATDQTGTWASSDNTIATVDQTGLVTALAEGTATITFTSTDGGFTATSTITPIDTPTTWSAIQSAVRAGKASEYWSVGDEIDVACPWTDPSSNTQYSWVWVVADIGTTYKESAPDTAVPSMTLIAKYATPSNYTFDNAESVVATEGTAQAGVYYYGWDGSSITALNLATGATIPYGDYTTIYKSSVNTSASNFNAMRQYGYNNWGLSNLRQWLNSSAGAGVWFTPTHVGDVAPNYSSQAGFLSGFSAEFQSVLTPTRSGTAANTATDGGTNYYTYDKMFLPSNYEVKLDTSLTQEGPVFALYANAQNADRVKYRLNSQTSTSYWWLRSAYRGYANSEYSVSTSGGSNQHHRDQQLPRCAGLSNLLISPSPTHTCVGVVNLQRLRCGGGVWYKIGIEISKYVSARRKTTPR